MTPKQAKALSALMLGVKEYHVLPKPTDVVDGCFTAGLDGRTACGVAETMNLWRIIDRSTTQSAGRLLNDLVHLGFAARVFVAGEPSPRYVPTEAGAVEHRRQTVSSEGMTVLELIQYRNPNHFTQREISRDREIAIWWLVRTQEMPMSVVGRLAGLSAGRIKQIVRRRDVRLDHAVRVNDRHLRRRRP